MLCDNRLYTNLTQFKKLLVWCVGKACTADGWPSRVVTSDTLAMFAHGIVQIASEPSFRDIYTGSLQHFMPTECSFASSFSSKAVERVRILSYCYYFLLCLVAFFILMLKPSFSQSLSLHSHLSLARDDLEFDCLVFGSHWRW